MRIRDPKATVLERRARFVAASLAALAGLTAAPRASADGGDASVDAAEDATDSEDAGDAAPEPRACLCVLAPSSGTEPSAAPAVLSAVAIVAGARRRKKRKTAT